MISHVFAADNIDTVVAFSYLENRSDQREYDYLSKIFPNSLADSFRSSYGITPLKPSEIDEILAQKGSPELKNYYNDFELPGLMEKIPRAKYLIYGYFIPNDNGNIEIVMSVYCVNSMEVFTFSTTGKMETELFLLVDKVVKSFSTLVAHDILYAETKIPEKSKIAFLTNVDGNELNLMLDPFFEKGFSILSVQSNELYSSMPGDQLLDRFRYTALSKTSFDRVRSAKTVRFEYSVANNSKSVSYSKKIQNLILKYYYSFPKQHEEYLKALSKKYNYRIDFLFVVLFDEKTKSASLRCFDLRKFGASLVWFQTGVRGKDSDSYTYAIAKEILNSMGR